jgi:hypothetical protein
MQRQRRLAHAVQRRAARFLRCERYVENQLRIEEEINERYPQQRRTDFDPLYASELVGRRRPVAVGHDERATTMKAQAFK